MKVLFGSIAALIAVCIWAYSTGYRANLTPSYPLGVYQMTDDRVERGALVAACLPAEIAAVGKSRGYLPPGDCPAGVVPVLKRVVAIAGDTVAATGSGLSVNGEAVPNSGSLVADSKGRLLIAWAPGLIGGDDVLLLSDYTPQSWDGRYFGPIPRNRILSAVKVVLLWPLDG